MKSVFLASAAATDLREIHDYIYEKNPKAADQLLEEVQAACDNLGRNPRIGIVRDDILTGIRLIVVSRNYVVFYRIFESEIEVVRILHGRRDFAKLFDSLS